MSGIARLVGVDGTAKVLLEQVQYKLVIPARKLDLGAEVLMRNQRLILPDSLLDADEPIRVDSPRKICVESFLIFIYTITPL
jgi:hypothetical protein